MNNSTVPLPEDLGLSQGCINILVKLAEHLPENNGISLAGIQLRRINTQDVWKLVAEHVIGTPYYGLLNHMPEDTDLYTTTSEVKQLLGRVHTGTPIQPEEWTELAERGENLHKEYPDWQVKQAMAVTSRIAAEAQAETAGYLGLLFQCRLMKAEQVRDVFLEFLKAAPDAEAEPSPQRHSA